MMTLITGLLVLRPSISNLLQSATSVITKCDSFFITKCDKCYYKVRQVLQSATIITKCDSTGGPVYPQPIIRRGGGLKNDNSKPCGFGLTMRWEPRIPRISNSRCINKDFDSKKILCELIPRGKKLLPIKINAIFNDSQLKKAAK